MVSKQIRSKQVATKYTQRPLHLNAFTPPDSQAGHTPGPNDDDECTHFHMPPEERCCSGLSRCEPLLLSQLLLSLTAYYEEQTSLRLNISGHGFAPYHALVAPSVSGNQPRFIAASAFANYPLLSPAGWVSHPPTTLILETSKIRLFLNDM